MLEPENDVLYLRFCFVCTTVYGCKDNEKSRNCTDCNCVDCEIPNKLILPEDVTSGVCIDCLAEIRRKRDSW